MGLFKSKEKVAEAPLPSNVPDIEACNVLFEAMCEVMYKDRRTLLELEIVLGMLQNEIIMNKTHNAIMAQIGRLAFVPPVFPPMPGMDEVIETQEVVKTKGETGPHYG